MLGPFILFMGLAVARDCPPNEVSAWIEAVRTAGREEAYLCIAQTPDARNALHTALADTASDAHGRKRIQRALALRVMQELDGPVDIESLRLLNADDLRLLRDAVHARRGRPSPVPVHEAVFSKFDWYQPDPRATNRRLTDQDRVNLQHIDKPPRAAPAAAVEEAPGTVEPTPAATPAPAASSTCTGCQAAPTRALGVWLWAGLGLLRRRLRLTRRS